MSYQDNPAWPTDEDFQEMTEYLKTYFGGGFNSFDYYQDAQDELWMRNNLPGYDTNSFFGANNNFGWGNDYDREAVERVYGPDYQQYFDEQRANSGQQMYFPYQQYLGHERDFWNDPYAEGMQYLQQLEELNRGYHFNAEDYWRFGGR